MTVLRSRLLCLAVGLECLLAAGACGDSTAPDAAVPVDARPPVGTLSLTWEITDGSAPLTCAEIGATVVRIRALPVGGGSAVTEVLSCESGAGTVSIRSGNYNVELALIANASDPIGEPVVQEQIEVSIGENTSLGTVSFEVEPKGTLELSLAAVASAGNCAPDADGGGGITQVRFELRDRQGTCVPTTFEIGAGASKPEGTYQADCAGAVFDCIESDQTIRATDVRSGPTTLVVVGLKGALECYQSTSQFDVAGGNLTTTLSALRLTLKPECSPVDAGVSAISP